VREKRQIGGRVDDGPSEAVPSLDVGQNSRALTPESGMFLRWRGRELAMIKGEFLDDLEDFEGFPLREQRKMVTKDLLKVSAYSGCLCWHVSSISECVFCRAWCLPWII